MPLMQSPPGVYTVIDGQRYLYFAGTSYLGLQGHADVIRAACRATEQFGIGSATSRTGFGNTPPVLDVERQAARFFGHDDAFYYASGYSGNNILALAFSDRFDAVFVDELSHYCVFEAARLSGRPVTRFAHRDAADLAQRLRADLPPGGRPLVMSDGVFAARGSIAPVSDYHDVLAEYPGAILLLDDAHAIGVLGDKGRGTFEHAGLFPHGVNCDEPTDSGDDGHPRLLLCGTLSKAIGGYGGIIPGAQSFIDQLKAASHYYGGASAPAIPVAAATARALAIAAGDLSLRTRLWENARAVKHGLRAMGLETDDTPVPIVCLTIGDAGNMQRIQRELMQRGIVVPYMAAYSGLGPEGALRLAVFATHTDEMIGRLLAELQTVV